MHTPGHRYTVIAHQISAEWCHEFTASSNYRMIHGLSGQLVWLFLCGRGVGGALFSPLIGCSTFWYQDGKITYWG